MSKTVVEVIQGETRATYLREDHSSLEQLANFSKRMAERFDRQDRSRSRPSHPSLEGEDGED